MPGDEPSGPVAAPGSARGETGAGTEPRSRVSKGRLLAGVGGGVVLLDFLTKQWIVDNYTLHEHVPVLGDVLRITYTHNVGAAFGINIGEHSRIFFLVLSLVALSILAFLYHHTSRRRPLRLTAIALVCGGAVGNILDRIRYERGVVDFIDMGLGDLRWYVFNVADMAVSVGAVLLLISFYLEDRQQAREAGAGGRDRDAAESGSGGGGGEPGGPGHGR